MEAAKGRWRPILLTAIFTGLRASELRGLRWADVDLEKRELHVRQRADRYSAIGKPKSEFRRADRSLNADRGEHAAGVEACLPEERGGACLSDRPAAWSSTTRTSSGAGLSRRSSRPASRSKERPRGRNGQAGKVHWPPCPEALLRLMVHQPARRWGIGASRKGGAGAPRPLVDHDDDGCLWAFVPAWRRFRRVEAAERSLLA